MVVELVIEQIPEVIRIRKFPLNKVIKSRWRDGGITNDYNTSFSPFSFARLQVAICQLSQTSRSLYIPLKIADGGIP